MTLATRRQQLIHVSLWPRPLINGCDSRPSFSSPISPGGRAGPVQTYALTGVIAETTPAGSHLLTAADFVIPVLPSCENCYQQVLVKEDTKFDIQLVRR